MGKEWELKYAASGGETLDAILADTALPWQQISMQTTYFDTPDGSLSARKWTLRQRLENGKSIITMKTAGFGGARGEWEYQAPDLKDAGERLTALGAPEALRSLLRGGIVPVCGASFVRRAAIVDLGSAKAELALDAGFLFREDRRLPIFEVELELKDGRMADVATYARELAVRFDLQPEEKSKFVRAVNL